MYIGLTTQGAKVRYLHHLYEARSGSSFPIHRSIRKHGEGSFELEILAEATSTEELKELEIKFISELNSTNRELGYNLTLGGDGTLGRKHSEETKAKLRAKALNRVVSEETRERHRAAHARNKNNPEYIEAKRRAAAVTNAKRWGTKICDAA